MSSSKSATKTETLIVGASQDGGRGRWSFSTADKIGHGSFGAIYLGYDLETGAKVAVKVESARSLHPQLQYESKVYKLFEKSKGVPRKLWFGKEGNRHVMVLELLGSSLEALFNVCDRRFELRTVLLVADQLLHRLEAVHARGFLHRDVKPENFLVGLPPRDDTLFVIDFGLAKKYFDFRTHKHLPFRDDKKLTGTARYASLNTHAGYEQSRRDDLEALGYLLIYFQTGKLPWQGLGGATKEEKYARIYERKRGTPVEELCANLPSQFVSYMRYVRSLTFEEVPNYGSLRQLFRDLWDERGFDVAGGFQWDHVDKTKADAAASPPPSTPTKGSNVANPSQTAPTIDDSIKVPSSFVRKKK